MILYDSSGWFMMVITPRFPLTVYSRPQSFTELTEMLWSRCRSFLMLSSGTTVPMAWTYGILWYVSMYD